MQKPSKSLKILCVCQKGCSRSVGTKYRLNRRRWTNVIAAGCETESQETLRMLCEWADVIFLAMPYMREKLPLTPLIEEKIEHRFTIGRDKWGYFRAPEMQDIIKQQLTALGFK